MMERSAGSSGAHPSESAEHLTERIRELEDRLAQLESGASLRARGRTMLDRVLPPEAARHFRNASKENLLGVRTLVDIWIRRIDESEKAAPPPERERIEIA